MFSRLSRGNALVTALMQVEDPPRTGLPRWGWRPGDEQQHPHPQTGKRIPINTLHCLRYVTVTPLIVRLSPNTTAKIVATSRRIIGSGQYLCFPRRPKRRRGRTLQRNGMLFAFA